MFILYKIYYDDILVYIGRTTQKLQARLHGHFFKSPHLRIIDINQVNKIEFAELKTKSDLYLYEIYYINKLKPPLNTDDKSKDELTIELPELVFKSFYTYLMDKWKQEINEKDDFYNQKRNEKQRLAEVFLNEQRKRRKDMPHEEYLEWLDSKKDTVNYNAVKYKW